MIEFSLNPPSGFADSCLDIEFSVLTERADIINVELFNETTKEQIEFLSVNRGFISNSNVVTAKNTDRVSGFINLFNKDRMHKKLIGHTKVDIKCKVATRRGDKSTVEEIITCFYNESQSLDAGLIPFDLIIDNPDIDVKNNIPLNMHMVCDSEKKFELAVKSLDGDEVHTFEVVTRKGMTDFSLPSEMLWYDLHLSKNRKNKFQIYWVKFEGVDYMNFMNRHYIPIEGTRITFNSDKMKPKSQKRNGPHMVLPNDFVISHRYFVHTWKEYTAFGDKSGPSNNALIHEVQDIKSLNKPKKVAKTLDIVESKQPKSKAQPQPKQLVNMSQKNLLNAYSASFSKHRPVLGADRHYVKTFKTPLPKQGLKKGGCGCSRKKNG